MSYRLAHTWNVKGATERCDAFTRLSMSAASGRQGSVAPVNYQPTIKLDITGANFQEGNRD
jgi:hypothetical protein